MKAKLFAFCGALFLFSCASTTKSTTAGSTGSNGNIIVFDSTVPARTVAAADSAEPEYTCGSVKNLEIKSDILTIELLQKLAECEEYGKLNDLYNNQSLHLDTLPVGYAAGKGAKVFNVNSKVITSVLDMITGSQWKGKIFYRSANGRETRGMNRIQSWAPKHLFSETIVPMGSFVSKLIDRHPYVPEVKAGSSLVLLNYAHPARKKNPPIQERVLEEVQVYDLMVAVPGKYGHVYIGKTWLGEYSKVDGEFKANDTSKLIAWYFLDYNQGALQHQAETDKFKEQKIELPLVNETNIRY